MLITAVSKRKYKFRDVLPLPHHHVPTKPHHGSIIEYVRHLKASISLLEKIFREQKLAEVSTG